MIGGKLGVEYIMEGVNTLSFFWKENDLTPSIEDDEIMWNGGTTHDSGGVVENENTPKYELMDNGEYIIYDGDYEDGRINE